MRIQVAHCCPKVSGAIAGSPTNLTGVKPTIPRKNKPLRIHQQENTYDIG
jgi:hypothetical protein